MDDTYLWSYDRQHLQFALSSLERRLAAHGLVINPGKTAVIYSEPAGEGHIHHRGAAGGMPAFRHRHHGTRLAHHIWGIRRCHPDRDESQSEKSLPQEQQAAVCPDPLKARIKLQQMLARGAALWGGQAWPISDTILKALNSTQLQQIRRMTHPSRRPGEQWEAWNVRTLRGHGWHLSSQKFCDGAPSSFSIHESFTVTWHALRWGRGHVEVAQLAVVGGGKSQAEEPEREACTQIQCACGPRKATCQGSDTRLDDSRMQPPSLASFQP